MTEERERPERPVEERERPRRSAPPVISLVALDRDLLRLVARRARLLQEAYAGRPMDEGAESPHASRRRAHTGTMRASERTRVEKTLREAWQAEAATISPDPRLSHQLFSLLQEIAVPGRGGEGRPKMTGFSLAPPPRAVRIDLPGYASRRECACVLALAAALGATVRIEHSALDDRTVDVVKALNQAGAALFWEKGETGGVLLSRGGRADFTDAVLFVGNEPMTLYLAVFLALPRLSRVKFMGGPDLKNLDLSALRLFLPQLGARLAPVVPGAKGLPVRLESSGMPPETVLAPENLPDDMLLALLVAASTWPGAARGLSVDCSRHPGRDTCLEQAVSLLARLRADCAAEGAVLRYAKPLADLPKEPQIGLDPLLAAVFLAMPAFCGGQTRLSGHWDSLPWENRAWADLLRAAGLETGRTKTGIQSTDGAAGNVLNLSSLPDGALPLGLALATRRAASGAPCPVLLPDFDEDAARRVDEFLGQAGCLLRPGDDGPASIAKADEADAVRPWTAPSAAWAAALALAAFSRPGLLLNNPGIMTEALPDFWTLYNSLPEPRLPENKDAPATAAAPAPAPVRRRRIVG